jgi:penicillin-binding protein 1A
MQLIRTILDRRERNIARKLNEFVLAWLFNFRKDKISILYSYSELAFFGSHLNGGLAAATTVFGKLPEQLSLEEAAFVAAMLVYPRPMVETTLWRQRVQRRASYGLSIYRRLEERHDQITR